MDSESKILALSEVIMVKPKLLSTGFDLKQHMVEIEISFIKQALEKANGVVSQAALLLGIRRTTLIEKIKKYQLVKKSVINNEIMLANKIK